MSTTRQTIGRLCLETVTKNHRKPDVSEYEDSLIKAAAIIIGTLEHVDVMKKEGYFACSLSDQTDTE